MRIAASIQPFLHRVRELPPEWKFLIALAAGLYILLFPLLRGSLGDPLEYDSFYSLRPERARPPQATIGFEGEWNETESGFLPGSRDAKLRLTTEPGAWKELQLTLNGPAEPAWVVRVSREFSASTDPAAHAGDDLLITEDQLATMAVSSSPIEIVISPSADPGPQTLLRRVAIRLSRQDGASIQPLTLPGVVYTPLLPVSLFLFLTYAGRRTRRQAAVLAGIAGALLSAAALRDERALTYGWAAATSFFLGASVSTAFRAFVAPPREGADPAWRVVAEWSAMGAIVGLALLTRWEQFAQVHFLPLLPDAQGYAEIARRGTFYETAQSMAPYIREPLFPALLRGWFAMTTESTVAARAGSILIGLLPVVLTWIVGRRVFGALTGLLAAAMLASNPWIARVSTEALRDELLTALFLAFAFFTIHAREHRWWRASSFGIVGALLALIRLSNLFLLIPLLGWECWRRRWKPLEIALALAVLVLPVVPHLVYNAQQSGGDLFFSSNVHTRYYLNRAFLGEPGFPATARAWEADPYAGDPVATLPFLATLGPVRSLWMIVRGYIRVFAWEFPHGRLFHGMEWLMIPGLVGAWEILRRRDAMWFAAATAVLLLPVALVATIQLDDRLAMPAAPLIYLAWSAGLLRLGEELIKRLRRAKPAV